MEPQDAFILVGTCTGEVPDVGWPPARHIPCCGRLLLLRLLRGAAVEASGSTPQCTGEDAAGRPKPLI